MRSFLVKPASSLKGVISLPADKSIAHRFIIIGSLSSGKTRVINFPANKDCFYTLNSFKKLGIRISQSGPNVTITAKGLYGLKRPEGPIFTGDSGTTLRLILGVLAGQNFQVKLEAGRSLSKRPMRRVIAPLRMMGASINAQRTTHSARLSARQAQREEYPPITIEGGNLKPIVYKIPVASAQVKSAIMLAALYVNGATKIIEPVKTRDHTERILKLFKADLKVKGNTIVIKGGRSLISPGTVTIPGDISSAAFFMVLAAILLDSRIVIKDISLNPSRAGIIRVLKRMGAKIRIAAVKSFAAGSEPMGDVIVSTSRLKGVLVKKTEIPFLIDELPILMVAACYAKGRSVFEGVGELRVKETDRVRSMTDNLRRMGADVQVIKKAGLERIIIEGRGGHLKAAKIKSFGDHRTAMSMIVAGLGACGKTRVDDVSCIDKSFPDFLSILKKLIPCA